ncbi:MAG: tyrosine-type recombinase/integrase [Candidatus Lokiarchaeota archaeon]
MDDLKISDFIDDFLIAKEIEEGCRPSTIRAYRYDIKKFMKIAGDLKVNSPVVRQRVRIFLKKLKDKGYTKKGISRKIATLRSFFKFLTLNEYVEKNPMSTIKTPKIRIEESLPKFLDLSEIKKIMNELQSGKKFNTKKSNRYYLIIRILYATMARVSELCNIRIKDVNFKKGYIRLRGKGNKERYVPVDSKTLIIIKKSLEDRLIYEPDDFLIVNTRNEQLTPRVVQNDIQIIKDKCNFPDSKVITPHIFRHTGATHLRRSGMDISELQDILGHSSPNTNFYYTA